MTWPGWSYGVAAVRGSLHTDLTTRRTCMSDSTEAQFADTSRDPVVTDGDKYKVVLENEHVRVLEYRDSPGQSTSPHFHPDYVLCAISSFRRRFVMPGGIDVVRDVPAG